VRYRGQYPLEYLRKTEGIGSYFVYPGYKLSVILNFLRAYLSALLFRKSDSVIVIQKVHSNFIYANLLKLLVLVRKTNTVYDIDDADYLLFPPSTIYWFCENCSSIMAGSKEIANTLRKYNGNVFFNTSPAPSLNIVKQKKNDMLHIGWIGGFGGDHKAGLYNDFFPALTDVPFKVKLSLLGVTEPEDRAALKQYYSGNRNVELIIPENINWRNERVIQESIAQFDIGIATLVNNEFQRSKSGFKAKQYLLNGVPVLSTNLPENNSVVQDGVNGYFCNNPAEFRGRIIQIAEMNADAYRLLSEQCRNSCSEFTEETYWHQLTRNWQSANLHQMEDQLHSSETTPLPVSHQEISN
jgi:glycosyltransferase involved in cell wall biosynthesis